MDEGLLSDLRKIAGEDAVLSDHEAVTAAGTDFVGARGEFGAVARPTTADQVAAIIGFAGERGLPVGPRAAGTNLCGGFVPSPEALALDLSAMNRVLDVDVSGQRAVVEPGVINGDLQAAVAPHGLCFSPDPASVPLSTIGGNIAENAGGPGCLKYGVTFHHVVAVDLALTDGRVLTLSEGDPHDLLGLAIGSEGILGVITRAVVRLRPVAEARWTALAAFNRVEAATETASAVIAAGILPSALEFCDHRQVELCEAIVPSGYPLDAAALLFAEVDGTPGEVGIDAPALEAVLRRFDPEIRVAATPEARTALWAGRLSAGHSYVASGKRFFICDVSVPRERFPAMVARARAIAAELGLDLATVGHAGDGNLHPVLLYAPEEAARMHQGASEIAAAALDLGGTLTGEHGIGADKRDLMRRRFNAAEVASFRAIKAAFDPAGVLNPGVLLPPRAPDEPALETFGAAVRAAAGSAGYRGEGEALGGGGAIDVDAGNLTVTAGAAADCVAVSVALQRAGLRCRALEVDGTVGGLVAKLGNREPARGALLAVGATLPEGERVQFGSAAVKDVAGLDAKRLLAGGRGGFGRVETATFRATPLPH
ncbi:MAG TPA: FAD-linked oxidase C-terminal domain-containing protein [Candidatus Dormibacteraeota bacterium]|jgi:glycolate oxidase|nr:FAD-linked oxidase C-terminal domain-containing protein [Candidatus Dormibacteraeota bacterium]